jgi:hypothetical protein
MLACPAPVLAELEVAVGDLEDFLNNVPITDGILAFNPPSSVQIQFFEEALTLLTDGDYDGAAVFAASVNYDLVEFFDTVTERTYFVLCEQVDGIGDPLNGLGTFVLNPACTTPLNIQVPHAHPNNDTRTLPESIDMFFQLQASFLQIAGTHRCASLEPSLCDGTTGACGGLGPYRISDAAHYVESFYQAASTFMAQRYPELVSVSVHGFTPTSLPASGGGTCNLPIGDTSLVVISNGTDDPFTDSLATCLALEYNEVFEAIGLPNGVELAGSCNATAGEPGVVWPCNDDPFCGQTNTQGREINGAADPCMDNPPAFAVERFIHLEQQLALRVDPDGGQQTYPGLTWQATIDAFAATFPAEEAIWVDFEYAGFEDGTCTRPFSTLADGLIAAAANMLGEVRMRPGTSSETMTVNQVVTLRAVGGPATIGQ